MVAAGGGGGGGGVEGGDEVGRGGRKGGEQEELPKKGKTGSSREAKSGKESISLEGGTTTIPLDITV
jgi:hypothetical protein